MLKIPSTTMPDSTLSLACDGYTFISKRCEKLDTDIFQTRLLLRPVVCMRGEEAAQKFYNTDLFERKGVVPKRILQTLFGVGGVQGLDGDAHRNRKQMFMELMTRENIERLVERFIENWYDYAEKWERISEVTLFEEINELLCQSVCEWSGVPIKEANINLRTKDFAAMIDAAGGIGLRYFKGRVARRRTERWIGKLIKQLRNGNRGISGETVFHTIATHRNLKGDLLDTHTAAVEVMNILRPTVAVARYVIFAALAMHEYPRTKSTLRSGGEEERTHFMQEVRRFYPFFPFAGARTRKGFSWKGYHIHSGQDTLLDLYGTNHDPKIWKEPETFNPERFRNREENAYNFIPQGGGGYIENHRCAGEWITMQIVEASIDFLLNNMQYDVPEQNLNVRLSRLPAIPKSRFVINNVKLK